MSLVTMEERRAFWRFEPLLKWYRKYLGEDWMSKVLDDFERKDKEEGTTHQREAIGAYLLRMHQIQLLIYMEKEGWKKVDGKFIRPEKTTVDEIKPE